MNALKFSAALALLIFTEIGRTDPLDTWTWRNPLPTGNDLNGITYGNGQFVAVGSRNATGLYDIAIVTSADGVNWVQRQLALSSENRWLNAIAYGNGQFVAVGDWVVSGVVVESPIVTSADGVNWTQRQSGTSEWLWDVAYGNGQFVAVGDGGTILTSGDGVSWVQRQAGTLNDLRFRGVTYGKGQFVAVGWVETKTSIGLGGSSILTPTILTSADGVNWVRRQAQTSGGLSGIAYGNGQFVAVGTLYSGDLLGIGSTIVTSVDGITWVQRQSGTLAEGFPYLRGIAYGNGEFAAVGGTILTSADGVNWTKRQSGTTVNGLSGIVYGGGHFVAVGSGGTILQSGSIITLAVSRNDGTGLLTLSLEGPTGLDYTIQSSTNLISWSNLTNITSADPTNVILDTLPAASERVFYRAYSQ